MEVVKMRDMLNEMESGELFSVQYVTADKNRKTGGEIKEFDGCRLSRADSSFTSDSDAPNSKGVAIAPQRTTKKPNHFKNRTRNLVLADGSFKKVNIWLIIGFNSKRVTLY